MVTRKKAQAKSGESMTPAQALAAALGPKARAPRRVPSSSETEPVQVGEKEGE